MVYGVGRLLIIDDSVTRYDAYPVAGLYSSEIRTANDMLDYFGSKYAAPALPAVAGVSRK